MFHLTNCLFLRLEQLVVNIPHENLKYVFFRNSQIEFFTDEFVEQLEGIEFLNVNNVGLETIQDNVLGRLNEIIAFWGSQNKLKVLEDGVFSGCRQLEVISLALNRISYIHKNAFYGLEYLTILDLSSNRLKNLDEFFRTLYNLVELNLSSNLIEYFHDETFKDLQNLKALSIAKNNIKYLNAKAFDALSNLEFLNMCFNRSPIPIIYGRFLKYNAKMKQILLCNNMIKAIERKFFLNKKPRLAIILLRMNSCTNEDFTVRNETIISEELMKFQLCHDNFDDYRAENQ